MAATSTGMTRLESFPFDSKFDGYDSEGYPIYDRAVDAGLLGDVFEKFFTNGVFPNPGSALQIGKAATGLSVTIQPGIGIIKGRMGGVRGSDAITVQLDTAAPQGNVAYAIMLRYDNTDGFIDSRSLLINVVKSDAASTPTPPAPDTTTPEVYELRLGYVVVPSGATDLSNATVTNEKGLDVCPFAAPFEEIDVSGIVSDFQFAADEALTNLLAYYEANKAAIDAALDDSAATYLQTQITQLQEELDNFNLSGSVDNVTVEYATAAGEASPKLRVKAGGIGTGQIAEGYVLAPSPSEGDDGKVLTAGAGGGLEWQDKSRESLGCGIVLWEGSASSGSITCPGISSYSVIAVETDDPIMDNFGNIVCGLSGEYFIGQNALFNNDPYYGIEAEFSTDIRWMNAFAASVSNDTLTAEYRYSSTKKQFLRYNGSVKKIWGIA